jgi:hypothetical protein
MKERLARFWCFLRGHDMVDEARFDNGRSWIGDQRCLRCGHENRWQHDHTF